MDQYAAVFGRLHPLLLHLPIGLLVGVAALEALAWWRGGKGGLAPAGLLWLTAAAAVAAAATGFVLSYEEGYGGATLSIHLWLGVAFAAAAVAAATARSMSGEQRPRATGAYRGALAAAMVLMLAAGHFGAVMTHGANFLFEPLTRSVAATDAPATGAPKSISFKHLGPASAEGFAAVAPILAERCNQCHSGSVAKAGLALDSFEALSRGSELGSVLDASDPAAGELLRRIKLPLDDPEHMPPDGRRQLTEAQIHTIEAWITGGVVASEAAENGEAVAQGGETELGASAPAETSSKSAVAAADPDAVAALAGTLAHVSPVAEGSGLLWVNVSYANPPLPERQILELLRPLAGNIADLTLANCDVSDAAAPLLAEMPHLGRLNLAGTAVTDATVEALAQHPAVEELVLTRTQVSDASIQGLLSMPALTRVYLWGSKLTPEAIARLRQERGELVADAGEFAEAQVLEIEPEPKFVDPAATTQAVKLAASNTTCPVSGAPVDARYLVVYEGRVIGFCCPECPKQFWADPSKFAEKLKP